MKKERRKAILLVMILIVLMIFSSGCSHNLRPDSLDENIPDPVPVEPKDPIVIEPGEIVETDYITINEITFYFDKNYKVGTFASGDYWVLGPVTIKRITPDFDGYNYGWEVNPVVNGGHGFQDGGEGGGFDASLVPELPYKAEGRLSIVKTTPNNSSRPCIKTAEVLTVVEEIPPDNGAAVFRPPYVGAEKPYYYVENLNTDLLPSYEGVSNMPTLESIEERFSKLQLDHKRGVMGRSLRPKDHMADYQPKNTAIRNNAVLRFMIESSNKDKLPALIQVVQTGIDKIHMIYLGQTWPDGGGHQPGQRILPAFAAVMLDLQDAKNTLREATFFHGIRYFTEGENTDGLILWGKDNSERSYWNYIMGLGGNRSNKDPYAYIDGGRASDGSYQDITSQSHKGEILATYLMPELKEAWNPDEWSMISNYVDRWVYFGKWTLPDPMAPYDGNPDNYGITYGPDENTGIPIKGAGRFPDYHGTLRDSGQYYSGFVAQLWNIYRCKIPGADKEPPFAAIIYPCDGRTVSGIITLSATAYGIHGIDSVQYRLNNNELGNPVTDKLSEEPFAYQYNWDTRQVSNGLHQLTVIATDKRNNTYESVPVNVNVQN